ncbi:MAG: LysM peptidoglycan-binding domain-containing protein [Anaerolineae bacterium]|nr:LysM peptidoglycan-binding domain-containing protein [Anaerolineae bacterium]
MTFVTLPFFQYTNTVSPADLGVRIRAAGSYNPSSRAYVVAAGDHLYRISLRFQVSVAAIAARSGVANPNVIEVGQVLIIP